MSIDCVDLSLQIERDLASGHPLARLLYLTPEALFSRHFLKSLKKVVGQQELRRLVVDEAHCISVRFVFVESLARIPLIDLTFQEWGSSFRPVRYILYNPDSPRFANGLNISQEYRKLGFFRETFPHVPIMVSMDVPSRASSDADFKPTT